MIAKVKRLFTTSLSLNSKTNYYVVPLKISLIYFVISFLWILFSDNFVNNLSLDKDAMTLTSTYKGWVYITIITFVLYFLLNGAFKKVIISEKRLSESNNELTATCEALYDSKNELSTTYEELIAQYEEKQNQYEIIQEQNNKIENLNMQLIEANNQMVNANKELCEINKLLKDEIEEHKRIEEELKNARLQSERANAAKTNFLANMSHEIRTPLNGILGMTELLLMKELEEDQKECLSLVKKSGNSLLRIINDILDYSKIEAEKVLVENSNFNLRELIMEVNAFFDISIKQKKLELMSSISDDIPNIVYGDQVRLRQILSNLVGNAVKFTDNGQINISINLKETRGEQLELLFSIKDTGIGIPEEQKELLFERFTQLDSSYRKKYQGTGLGLAISKKLIELMGGEIWIESNFGEGSTFFFTIVLETKMKAHSDLEVSISQGVKSLKSVGKTVMLVEDDYINMSVLMKFLENEGIEYISAENGEQAVELFESKNISVILMDIQMPVMDGIKATELIRNIDRMKRIHTPIIAITAYALKHNKESFLESGMDDYISKPVDFDELKSKLDYWIKNSV